ncbi:alpha-amylase family glycosyl hydrolase [Halonatronum saccharophilum]|uniref:alpha-amylase family glycosyl hydrolase n=1 Tax=Halonatronum saccharophilum TaxID=150060 RepID=UPI0004B56FFD|nr:alpha-amylase family glycosyl hydrolase [Halonatronum saccharophilum]
MRRSKSFLVIILIVAIVLSFQIGGEASNTHRTYYQIFVRSFYDSNGDGIGDLRGVTKNLDYLEELGVKGIWLMPIMDSESYHGYDVIDFYEVNSDYGSLEDFNELSKEANKRGIKVVLDLMLNHSSSDHPWFIEASLDHKSPYRDYYIWANEDTDTNERRPHDGARLWHRTFGGLYYGFFWGGMPDFNYENPAVREEMIDIGRFWLEQGADGFRLDAAKHIFPGDIHEKNLKWWREFKEAMEEVDPQVYLVGEVWDEPEVVGPYFEALESNFNFMVGEEIIKALQDGQNRGLGERIDQTYRLYDNLIGEGNYIDAPFITNHDQDRMMSQLDGDIDKAKVGASIYLTLAGNPFIYYGEEIGMTGTKPDERIREPFQWVEGKGEGESQWTFVLSPEGVSVESQLNNPTSLLNHYRELIAFRNDNPLLYDGDFAPIETEDEVLAYKRFNEDQEIYIYHNLSDEMRNVDIEHSVNESKIFNYLRRDRLVFEEGGFIRVPPYGTIIIKN